jgi:hypothetical protein
MKIPPVGAEWFHVEAYTDRQTHTYDDANRIFQFCERDQQRSIVHMPNVKQVPSIIMWSCVGFRAT